MSFFSKFNRQGSRDTEERGGILYLKKTNKPFTGLLITESHVGSNKIYKIPTSEVYYKDGLRHGVSKTYFFYKRLSMKDNISFHPDSRNIYHPDDQKIKEILHEYCEYREGKKHGIRKIYEVQGGIIKEEHYENDLLQGPVYEFNDSGIGYIRGCYEKGELVPYKEFYEDGTLKIERNWKLGIENQLIPTGNWKNGLEETEYDDDGYKIKKTKFFDTSHMDGTRHINNVTYYDRPNPNSDKIVEKEFISYYPVYPPTNLRFDDIKIKLVFDNGHRKLEHFSRSPKKLMISYETSKEPDSRSYLLTTYDPWTDEKKERTTNYFPWEGYGYDLRSTPGRNRNWEPREEPGFWDSWDRYIEQSPEQRESSRKRRLTMKEENNGSDN